MSVDGIFPSWWLPRGRNFQPRPAGDTGRQFFKIWAKTSLATPSLEALRISWHAKSKSARDLKPVRQCWDTFSGAARPAPSTVFWGRATAWGQLAMVNGGYLGSWGG